MKKLVASIIALAIFAGVGLLTAGQLGDNALRLAETERDLCYANQGYSVVGSQTIPAEVRSQCTQSIRTYEDGVTMRLVYGGLVGFAVAAIFLLIARFLMFRRREPAGAPPPAG